MCHQFLTFYDWCQCEVDSGHQTCGVGQPSPDCAGTGFKTVTMQCFCDKHATKMFTTEKKHAKHQRKQSRSSLSSVTSSPSRNSRYSDASLVQEKDPQQGPISRRRWYRRWSGIIS
ncbi:hypothetical protein BDW62DRAFT_189164 [Aspergillus aurantiobrunneus]